MRVIYVPKTISIPHFIPVITRDHGEEGKAPLKGRHVSGGRWEGESSVPLGVGLSLLMPSSTDWLWNRISRKPRIRVMDPGWEDGAILWDSTAEWNVLPSAEKKAGVGTDAYVCFASDYLEIALTFSYHFLCNDWKLPGMIPPRLLCYQKLCLWKTTFSHLQTARGIASSHRPCASLICSDLSGFFLSPYFWRTSFIVFPTIEGHHDDAKAFQILRMRAKKKKHLKTFWASS